MNHYVLFGVKTTINRQTMSPEMRMDCRLRFTDKDIEKAQIAKSMIENKLIPTNPEEAISIMDLHEIDASIFGMAARARFNEITFHQFYSSEFEIDDESIDIIIELANTMDSYKKMLVDSMVRLA